MGERVDGLLRGAGLKRRWLLAGAAALVGVGLAKLGMAGVVTHRRFGTPDRAGGGAAFPALAALVVAVGLGMPRVGDLAVPPVGRAACTYVATRRMSQVQDTAIREASALVASQRWPGIYWTLNDAKNAPLIYAVDQDGQSRGVFRVNGASNVDWEAMQLGSDGAFGFALFIGDVGNNELQRRELVIYQVPEPEPGPAGDWSVRETAPATPLHFVYPVGPSNTEALLVHPQTGEVVLISKQPSGISLIYRLPLPLEAGNTMQADFVDVLDVRTRDVASKQVTDGAVSSDGTHVALRTYAGVLVYDVPPSTTLADIDWQAPRTYPLSDGVKGEGITFRADSLDLLTVGEETPAALYETKWQCQPVAV